MDAQNAHADRLMRPALLLLAGLCCGTLAVPSLAAGQAASAALTQGVRAYDDLEFEQAAGLLRRALAVQGSGALSAADVSRALIYLVATELLRDRRDSARAIARRLLVSNPRFRPDELVFPPQLLLLYEVVRRATPAVIAEASADTAIRPGSEAVAVRLYASSVHDIAATLVALDGRVVRTLYRGPIGDSLTLRWNGLDSAGTSRASRASCACRSRCFLDRPTPSLTRRRPPIRCCSPNDNRWDRRCGCSHRASSPA